MHPCNVNLFSLYLNYVTWGLKKLAVFCVATARAPTGELPEALLDSVDPVLYFAEKTDKQIRSNVVHVSLMHVTI